MSVTPDIAGRSSAARAAIYPFALLILANLLWSTNWVIGRGIHEVFPPIALSFWRWTVAGLILAPIALPRLRSQWPIVRSRWKFMLLLGATGIAVPQCITYVGLNYTTVVNGSLLTAGNPFVMVMVAWLLDRHTSTPKQLVGLVLSFLGVVTIVAHGSIATLMQFHFNPGDILIVTSIPIWCVYSVLLRRRPREIDGLSFLFVLIPIGILTLAPAYAYESVFVRTPVLSWWVVLAVIYVGISASAAAYTLWNRGVELVGPSRASFTNAFQPMFATTLAILLLGEEFHAYHAIGFVAILIGWYLTSGLRIRAPV